MAMKSVGSPAAWSGNNAFHHPQQQQQQPRWLCGALRRLRGSVIGVVAARGVCNSHREGSAASTRKEAVRGNWQQQSWQFPRVDRRQLLLMLVAGVASAAGGGGNEGDGRALALDDQGLGTAGQEQQQQPWQPPDEFGSGSRQVDKERGLSFQVPQPERPAARKTARSLSRSLAPPEGGQRQDGAAADDDDDDVEVILVLEGVTAPISQTTSFDVYLSSSSSSASGGSPRRQYVGTYYNVPHMSPDADRQTSGSVRLGIGSTLKRLGITDVDNLVVTLEPVGAGPQDAPVVVKGVRIEYEQL